MAHRTCGITYYASLPFLDDEKSEIILVRKESEQRYVVAVPPSRDDPAGTYTAVTWKGDPSSATDDSQTSVRYEFMAGQQMRLMAQRPATWTECRQFECAIPLAALVKHIPAALGGTPSTDPNAAPAGPSSIPPYLTQVIEVVTRLADKVEVLEQARVTPPLDAHDSTSEQLLNAVSNLAAKVEALESGRMNLSNPYPPATGASGVLFGTAGMGDRRAAEAAARNLLSGTDALGRPQPPTYVPTGDSRDVHAMMAEFFDRLSLETSPETPVRFGSLQRTERAARANPRQSAEEWEARVKKGLGIRDGMPFTPSQLSSTFDLEKHKTLKRWWAANTQLWEELHAEPTRSAQDTLDVMKMLLTQHFKMLEQASLDSGSFSAAWGHSWLPPIDRAAAVGASMTEQNAVAQDVQARVKLADALKKLTG